MSEDRIAFLARDAIVHEFSGSTTAALNLLTVLRDSGADITVIVTSACSRSPRLYFRRKVPLPQGVAFAAPGYLRIGAWYLNLHLPRAWARAFSRLAARHRLLVPLRRLLLSHFAGTLVADAWDLSTPTAAETRIALQQIGALNASTIIANYAFWEPLLASPGLANHRRVILMHDLLSARTAKFVAAGLPLDCAPIDAATELNWLCQADYVLAAQSAEAETIRAAIDAKRIADASTQITTEVLLQPILMAVHIPQRQSDPLRCLFIGTNIQPNITGIQWFLDCVWPLVFAGNPHATLAIAGSVCSLIEGTHPNTQLLGVLPSLTEELDRAGVFVVPLLVGSGIKIKLLEALAHGKACVSTPIGVQGLEAWAPGVIDVADDPQDFAAAILALISNEDLRGERQRAARQLIRDHFGPDSEAAQAFAARILRP